MGIRLNLAILLIGFAFIMNGASQAFADVTLGQAMASLEQKKYKNAVQFAGKTLATPKQKPEVMAKALLTRGIAYRAQGKYAQAIADFANAEWLRKLPKEDLRELYAERALAYEAVGQTKLAAKDRKIASSSQFKGVAQRAKGYKKTSLKPSGAPTTTGLPSTDFFGGLGNLFGFNNTNSKKVETAAKIETPPAKTVVSKTGAPIAVSGGDLAKRMGGDEPALRKKIQVKTTPVKTDAPIVVGGGDLAVKQGGEKIASLSKKDADVKQNSAWAAQRIAEDKKNQLAAQKKILDQANKQPVQGKAPIKLTPANPKEQDQGNPVSNFFNSVFGGPAQKTPAGAKEQPAPPKERDVIVADQVAIETKSSDGVKKKITKKVVKQPIKKPVKVAAIKPAAKKIAAAPTARSLYHIQLGAFGEAGAADQFVDRLTQKYKSIVGNKVAMVVETDLGKNRRQYRVYLGPYRDRLKSISSCKAFKKVGLGCSLLE